MSSQPQSTPSAGTPTQEVRAEMMLPHEIEAALTLRSVVYVPLGSIEYHGRHLPIGLDGLTAHGVCTGAAEQTGGIVLPTLWYGVGGGHTHYPWTIMARTPAPLAELLERALQRLSELAVGTAVLFTGHFADEQLALIDDIAARWNAAGQDPRVLALSVSRTAAPVEPDHAGIFETTLLSALWPNRVALEQLPSLRDAPSVDPGGDVRGEHRHDPVHPLWGVMGPDPRAFDPDRAHELLHAIVTWTCNEVDRSAADGGARPG